jgi:hypothetical protein
MFWLEMIEKYLALFILVGFQRKETTSKQRVDSAACKVAKMSPHFRGRSLALGRLGIFIVPKTWSYPIREKEKE